MCKTSDRSVESCDHVSDTKGGRQGDASHSLAVFKRFPVSYCDATHCHLAQAARAAGWYLDEWPRKFQGFPGPPRHGMRFAIRTSSIKEKGLGRHRDRYVKRRSKRPIDLRAEYPQRIDTRPEQTRPARATRPGQAPSSGHVGETLPGLNATSFGLRTKSL
ncbi:hypothetical protein LIA77_07301 [Sarocladium implicatum]|nr:hypothetical protein LIA77_07301 [Sarocladium implicatum]